MIAFYLLLIMAIIGLLIMCGRHWKIGLVDFCIAIFFLSFWGFSATANISNRDVATAEYNTLMLYKDAVEKSSNEAMRFDYHNRVKDWNASYYNAKNIVENPWLNWIILPDMDLTEVAPIKFELRK